MFSIIISSNLNNYETKKIISHFVYFRIAALEPPTEIDMSGLRNAVPQGNVLIYPDGLFKSISM